MVAWFQCSKKPFLDVTVFHNSHLFLDAYFYSDIVLLEMILEIL